jgi:hypothetical protein
MAKPALWERLPLVELVWEDAALDAAAEGDLENPAMAAQFGGMKICSDVGYLIRKDRKVVVLAVGICRDDFTYRHANTIPRKWIKEINVLDRRVRGEDQLHPADKGA